MYLTVLYESHVPFREAANEIPPSIQARVSLVTFN